MPRMPRVRLGRLGLYLRTASSLRPEQAAHAIYRRFVPASPPHPAAGEPRLRHRTSRIAALVENRPFQPATDRDVAWHDPAMPRLWRYHRHYFDFLNDPERGDAWKWATIADWIATNPVGTLDAWEPYPASLRIVNWIEFLDGRPSPDPVVLASLYLQTLWLETNLERRLLANHFLKNAKALVFAGAFFDGADAERWLALGFRLLRAQVREQFLADGGHVERSPMYHAIALQDLLDLVGILRSAADPRFAAALKELAGAARRALAFLDGVLMPDGAIPLFNDAAFGVGADPADLFAHAAALVAYERPTRSEARAAAFPQSGYYAIRRGDDMLVIDCGELGPSYQPGHAHADCLSYELAIGGRRIVVDTGVSDYEASAARRLARSTAAHNTVSVDGRDQSDMWGAFRVARRARPARATLVASTAGARFFGSHEAYARFRTPIVVERNVVAEGGRWSFEDRVIGCGSHLVESRVHLAPGLRATRHAAAIEVRSDDGSPVATMAVREGAEIDISPAPYHPRFGVTEEATAITLSSRGELPIVVGYAIEGA